MGALKLTYHESQTAISENWKIFVRGIEKNASSQNFCKDYFTFGSIMPGRNYQSNSYRFGYNAGSEKDDEITGVTGSHITTFYREYDTRLGRTWSLDPVFQPWQSSYSSMDNNPIWYNDPLGDLTDGWENENGDIIYIDDEIDGEEGDEYISSKTGMKWTNIGTELKANWSYEKQVKFYNAHDKYIKNKSKELNAKSAKLTKHIKIATPILDVLTDFNPVIAIPKSIYSLTTGTNPIEDYADTGLEGDDKYNSKEDEVDENLAKAGLVAEYATACSYNPDLNPKLAKKIPIVGKAITAISILKTLYNAYVDENIQQSDNESEKK